MKNLEHSLSPSKVSGSLWLCVNVSLRWRILYEILVSVLLFTDQLSSFILSRPVCWLTALRNNKSCTDMLICSQFFWYFSLTPGFEMFKRSVIALMDGCWQEHRAVTNMLCAFSYKRMARTRTRTALDNNSCLCIYALQRWTSTLYSLLSLNWPFIQNVRIHIWLLSRKFSFLTHQVRHHIIFIWGGGGNEILQYSKSTVNSFYNMGSFVKFVKANPEKFYEDLNKGLHFFV